MKSAKNIIEASSRDLPALNDFACASFLADKLSPVQAFERLRAGAEHSFLFESSETDSRLARFSILGFRPAEQIIIQGNKISVKTRQENSEGLNNCFEIESSCPLDFLKNRLAAIKGKTGELKLTQNIPFACAYVGYLAYGATSLFDGIKKQARDPLAVPDGVFCFYDTVLVFDHRERQMRILSFCGKAHVEYLKAELERKPDFDALIPVKAADADFSANKIVSSMTKDEYLQGVEKCRQYILEGQAFQIVLAQRFAAPYAGDPFLIYRALQAINPSPYGYYLQFPDFSYLGSSPERLLSCRNHEISLTALAGTRPRGQTPEEDEKLEKELFESEKEMAEHYMLVDLGRNDLGRVAEIGSVNPGKIAELIKYGQVMHLSTEIKARLRKDLSCFDAVRSCFPAGTVSGAPKIRAMELLAELEPEQRGIYSGMVAYFDLDGNTDSAIAIRSALVKDGIAHVSAGAGIVMDSQAESEYEETRNKASAVLKAIAFAQANS